MSTIVSLHGLTWPKRKTLGVVASIPGALSPPYSILDDDDGDYNIWLVEDGTPTQITPFDYNNSVFDSREMWFPVLSDNKRRIVFRGLRLSDSAEQMLAVDWFGGTPNAIVVTTVSGSRLMWPMWHPDSDQIVFCRGADFVYGGTIEKTDWSGTSPTVLYTPATNFYAGRPSYNHDGTKIAFWLYKSASNDAAAGLYVMDADGSNVTQIKSISTTGPYRFDGQQYAWANTQNVLVYDNKADGKVYVINDDGTGETQVGVGEIDSGAQPCRVSKYAWADDDSLIYISSQHSGAWLPYSLETDGSGVTRLNDSHGPFNQQYFTNLFYWKHDQRLYFIEIAGTSSGAGKFASMALDGTDYRVDHLLTDTSGLSDFYSGTGFEFV